MLLKEAFIMLDGGHSLNSPGAFGGGMEEGKINANVVNYMRADLQNRGIGKVMLTHEFREDLGVTERGEMIRQLRPDFYFSSHENAGGGKYGLVCCQDNPASRMFAAMLKLEWEKIRMGKVEVWEKQRELGLLRIPALNGTIGALGEFCFLDTEDVQEIDSYQEQNELAFVTVNVICDFLKSRVKRGVN